MTEADNEAFIEYISQRKGVFHRGIVSSPFHKIIDQHKTEFPEIGFKFLSYCLLHAGWIDKGRLAAADFSTKKYIRCTRICRDEQK
jgi:hypothetical protein